MAFRVLDKLGMEADEIATVVTAIGNHDEGTGVPVNAVAAALIIADKCDVRRTRVRNEHPESFDIHDRVNYSVEESELKINAEKTVITLELVIDNTISAVMDYFQIFLGRMQMAKSAYDRTVSLLSERKEKYTKRYLVEKLRLKIDNTIKTHIGRELKEKGLIDSQNSLVESARAIEERLNLDVLSTFGVTMLNLNLVLEEVEASADLGEEMGE